MLRKRRNTLFLALITTIVAIVVGETGLRVLGVHDPVLYEEEANVGYRIKPDQDVSFYGNRIVINRFGARDARSFQEKARGTRRILVLGDSVTWGGVRLEQEKVFTSKLEQQLENVEVINAGVNGYSVVQMAELYRSHLTALEPDVVIAHVIPGDFLRPPVTDLVESSPAFPLARPVSALLAAGESARVVMGARLGWQWLQPPNPSRAREEMGDDERLQRNVAALLALRGELSERQELVVAVSPFRDHAANPPLPDVVTTALNEADVPLWVLGGDELERSELFVDHVHLSAEGHSRVAEELATRLREHLGLR